MKRRGITRTIDDVGRVTIPTELRERYDFTKGSEVEFFVEGQDIVMISAEDRSRCVICGEPTEKMHRGKAVCETCKREIRRDGDKTM